MKFIFDSPGTWGHVTGQVAGGAEYQQWLLGRALVRRNHEVIFYIRTNEPLFKTEVLNGVVFKWITPLSPIWAWPKLLAKERPDWWYFRGQDYYLGFLVPLAHTYGTKVAFACAFDTDCLPSQALTRRKYLWPSYALGLKGADRILIQHKKQRWLLPAVLQQKAICVPSIAGVIEKVTDRDNYVAWVGVLREPKRPHLLVEIARKLPNVRFVVCGPTSLHRTRPEYAQTIISQLTTCSNIDYRGKLSPEEAQRIISHASLLLSTSDAEGFPNTFLQAWGAGVPVIAIGLDPGGAIKESGAGIVVKNTEQSIQAISLLSKDKEINKRLGQNGFIYVQQRHNEDFVLSCLLRALKNEL